MMYRHERARGEKKLDCEAVLKEMNRADGGWR